MAPDVSFSTENWLTIVGFAVMATIYVVTSRFSNKIVAGKLEMIDGTIEDFKIELKKLNEVLVVQATQNARITFMEERTLQHGRRVDGLTTAVNKILLKLAMPDPVLVEGKMTTHGDSSND